MLPTINDGSILVALIVATVALSLWFAKTKIGKYVGPALSAIIFAIILHNIGIAPSWHDVYTPFVSYGIPIAISVMLLSVDVATLKRLVGQPLISMLVALVSVFVVAMGFGLLFHDKVIEGWKVAGMFVGTYTGGSPNLTAIAVALDAANDTIAAANAADYVIGIPFLLMAFIIPNVLKKSKWFQKKWPYRFSEQELVGDGKTVSEVSPLDPKECSILDITLLFTIGFVINALCEWISGMLFGEMFFSAGKMILMTTISLCVAQIPAVKKLRCKYDIGLLLCMGYLCIIGFMIDIPTFLSSTLSITLFCLCVVLGSTILHVLICRLLKIKYEYVWLSITAGVADGITSSLVANSSGWYGLAAIALVCGTLGEVTGNYIGIAVAYIIRMITGG